VALPIKRPVHPRLLYSPTAARVEVRATKLRAQPEKRGLTPRQLAKDVGVSQNYIPAIERGARKAGPQLQERLLKYFGCDFEDLFEIVLVDPESGRERVLERK
jgi:transcriptional regulator with XRE-family HTH domain